MDNKLFFDPSSTPQTKNHCIVCKPMRTCAECDNPHIKELFVGDSTRSCLLPILLTTRTTLEVHLLQQCNPSLRHIFHEHRESNYVSKLFLFLVQKSKEQKTESETQARPDQGALVSIKEKGKNAKQSCTLPPIMGNANPSLTAYVTAMP